MNLTDGEASITTVCWASRLNQLNYVPVDGDGITVVGKLNFWAARASLAVQAIDIRPSVSTVERRFEAVKALLAPISAKKVSSDFMLDSDVTSIE